MKVNILNLVPNDLASCCLLPNKATKAQRLKKTKTQTFVISHDYLGWPDSSWACFTGADSSFMFNRKGDCGRRSRWFPSLSGLQSLLKDWGSCHHVLFTSIRLDWLPYWVVSGQCFKIVKFCSSKVPGGPCCSGWSHSVTFSTFYWSKQVLTHPLPPPLPSAKIHMVKKQTPPLDGICCREFCLPKTFLYSFHCPLSLYNLTTKLLSVPYTHLVLQLLSWKHVLLSTWNMFLPLLPANCYTY